MIAYFLRVDRSLIYIIIVKTQLTVVLKSKNFMVAGRVCEPVVVGYKWSKITAIFICFFFNNKYTFPDAEKTSES